MDGTNPFTYDVVFNANVVTLYTRLRQLLFNVTKLHLNT